jgi:hypothetical protein
MIRPIVGQVANLRTDCQSVHPGERPDMQYAVNPGPFLTLRRSMWGSRFRLPSLHSDRNACITSTRAARAAGKADAITAAASSTTTDPTTGAVSGIRISGK